MFVFTSTCDNYAHHTPRCHMPRHRPQVSSQPVGNTDLDLFTWKVFTCQTIIFLIIILLWNKMLVKGADHLFDTLLKYCREYCIIYIVICQHCNKVWSSNKYLVLHTVTIYKGWTQIFDYLDIRLLDSYVLLAEPSPLRMVAFWWQMHVTWSACFHGLLSYSSQQKVSR